jgi:glycosyltransferase involved in cell wall biosynthesis
MGHKPPVAKDETDGTRRRPVQVEASDAAKIRGLNEPASTCSPDMSAAPAGSSTLIALLGRRDVPTDGVEDYCRFLGPAMGARGYQVEIVRVPWEDRGWIRAWMCLWRQSREWKGNWVLVQYTALMWSRRGLPLAFLGVLLTLKARGVRLITVFHDFAPYAGTRYVDRIRRACQLWVLRRAYGWTRACVLPVPKEQVNWLPRPAPKASFIPVGASIPPILASDRCAHNGNELRTIAIYCVTGGGTVGNEVADIAFAAREAAKHLPHLRLVTLGRGSLESQSRFRQALAGSAVEYNTLGVLPAEEVSRTLSNSDVSLFVRGPISTQRTSAIAAIACGTPLVAYGGSETPSPLSEAGVVLVPWGDQQELARSVIRILTDEPLWRELHRRNLRAHARYFSWEAISEQLGTVLDHG